MKTWLSSQLSKKQASFIKSLMQHSKNVYIYTVGTESIQTPLHFSLFVILQPFAKII